MKQPVRISQISYPRAAWLASTTPVINAREIQKNGNLRTRLIIGESISVSVGDCTLKCPADTSKYNLSIRHLIFLGSGAATPK